MSEQDDGPITLFPEGQKAPRISIVISTYNRADHLAVVLAALREQTLDRHAFEVIVVDNGSSQSSTSSRLALSRSLLAQSASGTPGCSDARPATMLNASGDPAQYVTSSSTAAVSAEVRKRPSRPTSSAMDSSAVNPSSGTGRTGACAITCRASSISSGR